MSNLPDHLRCFSCGGTGETDIYDHGVDVYCKRCDAFTAHRIVRIDHTDEGLMIRTGTA